MCQGSLTQTWWPVEKYVVQCLTPTLGSSDGYLQIILNLPLADKMSMANSVELRTPFLDHDLVNFVFRIPDKYKIKALKEKQVLKESMRGFLPGSICRREKQPLQPPGKWFIDSASELVSEYLSENVVREKGYFNPRFIEKVLREYGNGGRGDYSGVVVVALFVHLWDEIFMQ